MKNNTVTLAQVQLKQVIEQLKDMSDSSLQVCHNSYCIEIGYEDIVYDNDEHNVNEQFETPFDVLRNIQYYNLSDNYFYFHNGNLVSFNYLTGEDSPITFSELAQWIVGNDLYNEYDIKVTTLDDMYNAILDNLEDANSLDDIIRVAEYLGLTVEDFDSNNESPADYECNVINDIMNHIHSDFELLSNAAEFMKLDV